MGKIRERFLQGKKNQGGFTLVEMIVVPVIKFLGENPGACPWDEAKKYFSKSLMSISSEYYRSNSIKGTFN